VEQRSRNWFKLGRSRWKERRAERRPLPRVFCERVRKLLMGKELVEHSFLKSAEEYENRGVNFWPFSQKSGKSEKSAWGRGLCSSGGTVVLLDGEFNAPTRSG
jgi:hypothetical protein